uniref:TPT domain-containing protein n=1 Tax=Steinernema glaseri TaxID=37863 RepID=A0A1I7XXZ6_9BILA
MVTMSGKKGAAPSSLAQQYAKIIAAVSAYWVCSIGLVFVNKYLLSSSDLKLDAPLFVTWYQCVCTVGLCLLCAYAGKLLPNTITFPEMTFDYRISREVLPLSFVFVGMIAFNNLCLKHVGVSFYYVGRSLTTVFNVVCSYLILGIGTSKKAMACCLFIIGGFFLGVNQEDAAGSLSVSGVIFGVMASLFVALNAIFTQRSLPIVGDSVWRLTFYNNINACMLFLPLMLFSGEFGEVAFFPHIGSAHFWFLMSISGLFGFLMGYVTGWQIQVTSPLTHNISGTAKAAAQTVMAVIWWNEFKPILWWISNVVVLLGSGAYTKVKRDEMKAKFSNERSTVESKRLLPTTPEGESSETV